MIQPNEAVVLMRRENGKLDALAMDIGTSTLVLDANCDIQPLPFDEPLGRKRYEAARELRREVRLHLGIYALAVEDKRTPENTEVDVVLNTMNAALGTMRKAMQESLYQYRPLPTHIAQENRLEWTAMRTEYVTRLYATRLRQLAEEMEALL